MTAPSGTRPAAFAALGLVPALLRAVSALGYAEPTAIQAAALPPALRGQDVIGCAPTGSGKTAAFGLALLQRLALAAHPSAPGVRRATQALVLVPTRELAVQVGEVISQLARQLTPPVKVFTVFGGVSINPQMLALRGGADVVVATPGRLLDLVSRHALALDAVHLLVLDEADRLLDEGFADELANIAALLPRRRQNLLFSATFAPGVQWLAQAMLRDPVRIGLDAAGGAAAAAGALNVLGRADAAVPSAAAADAQSDASTDALTQQALSVDVDKRTPLLRHLIESRGWPRVLVFVATRYTCEHVAAKLRRSGIHAAALHGELSQGARTRVLDELNSGALRVLVATDLAARGLHLDGLPVVLNYDLPRSAQDYTHRIGRTARAGATGLAVSFVSPDAEAHWRLIEKRQGRRVPRECVAGFEPQATHADAPQAIRADEPQATRADAPQASAAAAPPGADAPPNVGGIKGRRKSKKDKLREAAARGDAPA